MAAAIADLLAALKAWQSAIQQFKQQGKSWEDIFARYRRSDEENV